jgi:hypothetical protein
MKAKKPSFVGTGEDVKTGERRLVLDGSWVFWMMDSAGIDLGTQMSLMQDIGVGFDVKGLIAAAVQTKNFQQKKSRKRLFNILCPVDTPKGVVEEVNRLLDETYGRGVELE